MAQHFLTEMTAEVGPRRLTPEARARLQSYDWPGNVRELRNVIRRAAFLAEDVIDVEALELEDPPVEDPPPSPAEPARLARPAPTTSPWRGRSYRDMERDIFGWALRRHGGSRRRAAKALGISRSTFCDRVKRMGLKP